MYAKQTNRHIKYDFYAMEKIRAEKEEMKEKVAILTGWSEKASVEN